MKLRDLALDIATQMEEGAENVVLRSGERDLRLPIVTMAYGDERVYLRTGDERTFIFERLTKNHRIDSIMYAVVHKGHRVMRIRRVEKGKESLLAGGVVDGRYESDVETACARLFIPGFRNSEPTIS